MPTGKPTDDSLRAEVLRRLAMLDDLARDAEPDSLPLARTELHRLTDGWRLLLTVHQPGVDGRCRACPARLRRRRWPCGVWTMAYQHLIGESPPARHRLRLHRLLRLSGHPHHTGPGRRAG